ncbi:MAG: nucleotidyltransferase domain-containing protein [bacterium]
MVSNLPEGFPATETDAAFLRFIEELIARFQPRRVIWFGSRAWGGAREDSDYDVLVEAEFEGSPYALAGQIRIAIPRKFRMDLLVESPATIQYELEIGDQFFREVLGRGRVLHEASHP